LALQRWTSVRIPLLFSSNVDQLVQFCALLYLMNVIGY
jgi:hypothetical protein